MIIKPGKNPSEIKCRNSAFMCGNGGTVASELAAGGLKLPGQKNADKRTLLDYASNFNIPEPVVDNMIKQYESIKEQAYQGGQRLALMKK